MAETMETTHFRLLLRQVRLGEADAATELVQTFEPAIRRHIRMHLTDARMHRLVDSVAICQSVLACFFVRFAAGQFDVESPRQLLKLLATMARNKIINLARDRQNELKEHPLDTDDDPKSMASIGSTKDNPSRVAIGKELLQQTLDSLTTEERWIAKERAAGRKWQQIAEQCEEAPDTLRKRLTRALDLIVKKFGLEGDNHESADTL